MKQKFCVRIELELHTITCPGVWLCPNGCIEILVKTLGCLLESDQYEPKFPILLHSVFTIEGYFKNVQNLNELNKLLDKENIEIKLCQYNRCLSYFYGKLGDVLYERLMVSSTTLSSSSDSQQQWHSDDCEKILEVLMTPSQCFPGILAPKIQLSAHAVIYSTGNNVSKISHKVDNFDLEPTKIINSKKFQKSAFTCHQQNHQALQKFKRQKPVCHAKRICGLFSKSSHRINGKLCDKCIRSDLANSRNNFDYSLSPSSSFCCSTNDSMKLSRSPDANSSKSYDSLRPNSPLVNRKSLYRTKVMCKDHYGNHDDDKFHHINCNSHIKRTCSDYLNGNYSNLMMNSSLLLRKLLLDDDHFNNCCICKIYYKTFHSKC